MPNNLGASIRIRGAPEMLTKLGNIRREPQKAMRQAALARSSQSVQQYQTEMGAAYTSAWATGQVSRSIRAKVKNQADGVSVQFLASSGEREHIKFITHMLPDSYTGGHFASFPVAPFTIKSSDPKKLLRIRFPGHARRFIQDPTTGRMSGSKPGGITKRQVLWGSASGGFERDVMADVTKSEGAIFVEEMMAAVAAALNKSTQ